VWLAAQRPGVAGVVLHSPLLSGMRVFSPGLRFYPAFLDIFPNHLLIKKVDVPVLVMHDMSDEVRGGRGWPGCRRTASSNRLHCLWPPAAQVIDFSAGRQLAELAPAAVPPLLAAGFDHQNLEASPEYLPRLKGFLELLLDKQQQPPQQATGAGGQ
jgi:hypothetical protein